MKTARRAGHNRSLRSVEKKSLLREASIHGRSSLTNEKDHRYFLNRFVCVGEYFDG